MRDILSKVVTGSMIAGAALLVAACGGGGETNTTNTGNGMDTDIYNTEVPADVGNTGIGGNVSGDLSNASNAVENAATAIDNAQSNAGQ